MTKQNQTKKTTSIWATFEWQSMVKDTTEYVAQASTKQNKGRTTLSFKFFP